MKTNKQHLDAMRNTIKAFAAEIRPIAEKQAENRRIYQEQPATEENERLQQQIISARNNARALLQAEADQARADVKAWAQLKGEDLTDDYKLLKSTIDLSQDDLSELVNRYKDNATMLRAIADYAKDKEGVYLGVLTAENRLQAWERLEGQAYSLLDSVYEQPAGGPMLDLSIDRWADPEYNAGMASYAAMFEG